MDDDANRNYFNGANFHELELDGNDIIAVKAKLLSVQTVFDILVSQEWRC